MVEGPDQSLRKNGECEVKGLLMGIVKGEIGQKRYISKVQKPHGDVGKLANRYII